MKLTRQGPHGRPLGWIIAQPDGYLIQAPPFRDDEGQEGRQSREGQSWWAFQQLRRIARAKPIGADPVQYLRRVAERFGATVEDNNDLPQLPGKWPPPHLVPYERQPEAKTADSEEEDEPEEEENPEWGHPWPGRQKAQPSTPNQPPQEPSDERA